MMRLTEAQRLAGWDSSAYFPLTESLTTQPLKLPVHTMAAVLDDRVIKNPEFGAPISVLRDQLSTSLDSIPANSDLIHLHWINGVIPLENVRNRFPQARLVWTLHDMNPFTGACHQSLGCDRFLGGCRECPAVRSFARDLVARNFKRKQLDTAPQDVAVISPSEWLASKARASPIFEEALIEVVANPLAQHFLGEPGQHRAQVAKEIVVLLVARDLSDPLKGIQEVVSAHQGLEVGNSKISLHLVGAKGHQWSDCKDVEWLGVLDQIQLKDAYANSDYLIQPSTGESFGLSVIEAASQGTTPIVRGGGALEEVRNDLGLGMVFTSPIDLRELFRTIAEKPRPNSKERNHLRRASEKLYGPETVRKQYDKIYSKLGICI